MLDRGLLAAVAAVVREGSFERAARVLGVTPSAVSQRVRLLEERMGTVLVVRGQPCAPTEAGERVCRHAELVTLLEAELGRALPGTSRAPATIAVPTLRVAVNADSLGAWFVDAMAEFAKEDAALLDIVVDDQDHTADWLRRGRVLAAVTALAAPVQGCRSRRLGSLRYVATASPAFARRHFPDGVQAAALARAPMLRFDHKDRLQARWMRRWFRREVEPPTHWLPSAQAFVDAALVGLGWGMNPEGMVRSHLETGRLVELLPGRPMDVPLHWQVARLPVPSLARLTRAVERTAGRALVGAPPADLQKL